MELEIAEIEPQREQKQRNGLIYDSFPFVESSSKFIAFFAAISHNYDYELKKIWSEYTDQIGQYVIAREVAVESHPETGGQHYHFVAQMTPQLYHTISKRIFKDTFKLRGIARGGARQYGKIKEVRDETRMIAYCIKDGDYVTNIPDEEMKKYKEVSFKKGETNFKKGTTFTQRVKYELQKKYPNKKWYPCTYVDGIELTTDSEIVLDKILDMLGETVKVFDRGTLHKLFNGVMNSLDMTSTVRQKYKRIWKAEILSNECLR